MSAPSRGLRRTRGRGGSSITTRPQNGSALQSRDEHPKQSAFRGRGRGRGALGQFRNRSTGRPRGNGFVSSASRGRDYVTASFSASASQDWRDPNAPNNIEYDKRMNEFYQRLKKTREKERADAIKNGLMADPNKPTSLAEAITIVGTCQDMCPEFDRVQRIVQNMVDRCEKQPSKTNAKDVPCEAYMVKPFRRSAAGNDEQIPSDIRPPLVLKKTLDYLLNDVVGGPQHLGVVHKFVWDRTRAIRNDFSIQQVTKAQDQKVAIECFERIARFHILALHQLSRPCQESAEFDHHQEREQLSNTLLSLMYYYDDTRQKFKSPCEAEFRAYCIIFEIQDQRPDLEDRVQTWPRYLLQDRRIQVALRLYEAASNTVDQQGPLRPLAKHVIAQQNYGKFWAIVASNSVSYLAACVAEIYFNMIRSRALESLWKSYRKFKIGIGREEWTLKSLCDVLAFDEEDEVRAFCEDHGFTIVEQNGQPFLQLGSVRAPLLDTVTRRNQAFNKKLVESKRLHRTLSAVINGVSAFTARAENLVDESLSDEAGAQKSSSENGASLFIPEDENSAHKYLKAHALNGIPSTDLNSDLETPEFAPGDATAVNPFSTALPKQDGTSFAAPSTANAFGSSPFSGNSAFGAPSVTTSINPFGASALTPSVHNNLTSTPSTTSTGFKTASPSITTEASSLGTTPLSASSIPSSGFSFGAAKPVFGSIPSVTQNTSTQAPKDDAFHSSPAMPFSFSSPSPFGHLENASNDVHTQPPTSQSVTSSSIFSFKPSGQPSTANQTPTFSFGQSPPAQASIGSDTHTAFPPASFTFGKSAVPAASAFSTSQSMPKNEQTSPLFPPQDQKQALFTSGNPSSVLPGSLTPPGSPTRQKPQESSSPFSFSQQNSVQPPPNTSIFSFSKADTQPSFMAPMKQTSQQSTSQIPSTQDQITKPPSSSSTPRPSVSFSTEPTQQLLPPLPKPLNGSIHNFRPKSSSPLAGPPMVPASPPAPDSVVESTIPPNATPESSTSPPDSVTDSPPGFSLIQRTTPPPAPSAEEEQPRILQELSNTVMLEDEGLLKMFIEHNIGLTIRNAIAQVEDEKSWRKAHEVRSRLLARRYGRIWRNLTWDLKITRKGRECRKKFKENMMELEELATLDGFKKNEERGRMAALAATATATAAAAAMPPPKEKPIHKANKKRRTMSQTSVGELPSVRLSKRQRSASLSTVSSTASDTASQASFSSMRSSRLSDTPSMFSRSTGRLFGHSWRSAITAKGCDYLRTSQYRVPGEPRKPLPTGRLDRTQTDYFRLKALGIEHAKLYQQSAKKRSRESDNFGVDLKYAPASSSPFTQHTTPQEERSRASLQSDRPPSSLLEKARATLSPTPASTSPPSAYYDPTQDDFLQQFRAARKALEEEAELCKQERMQLETQISRSSSFSSSSDVAGGREDDFRPSMSRTERRIAEKGASGLERTGIIWPEVPPEDNDPEPENDDNHDIRSSNDSSNNQHFIISLSDSEDSNTSDVDMGGQTFTNGLYYNHNQILDFDGDYEEDDDAEIAGAGGNVPPGVPSKWGRIGNSIEDAIEL